MFEIRINGIPYTRWETATVSRSIDNSSGTFSFSTSSLAPKDFHIKRGDPVSILISGEPKITGFVDQINANGDSASHTVNVLGRDNVCDLIDSSVPDAAKVIEGPISLKKLCENVISSLDINIIIEDISGVINTFTEEELQAAESGDKCMDYLQSYARKKQVFLIPSGNGKLLIFRPGADKATSQLLHELGNNQNNVKSWSVSHKQDGRYNKYICRSQDNIGFSESAEYSTEGMDRNGEITDNEIRTGRRLEINAEESMDDDECLERAKEESNIRRARSTEYIAVVVGTQQIDGKVWDIGQRVTIKDDIANVKGSFIIRSVEYSTSLNQGEQTRITCAPIDAYKVQAVASKSDKRKSNEGTRYIRPELVEKERFQR